MIDEIMYKKYLHYKLDVAGYNYFRLGSEAVLFAAMASAYNLGEPWVGYCWEPAWVMGKMDVVLLEDAPFDPDIYQEGACEIPKQALRISAGGHFPEKAPELLGFFKNYKTGSNLVSEALNHMEETKESHANTAVWFLKKYGNALDDWLAPEQAKKVRDALAKR